MDKFSEGRTEPDTFPDVRLLAETTRIDRAGQEIERVAGHLHDVVRSASDVLGQAESDTGDAALGAALRHLGRCLAVAEQQSVSALGVFGEQVQLAASSYRQTDQDLAGTLRAGSG
ncbi:MAG: hypothetical protein JWO12_2047 [Frankiales bacterium]|nr:hypothetical protein [Frankiales bacterium]